jgi:hypothetical protein
LIIKKFKAGKRGIASPLTRQQASPSLPLKAGANQHIPSKIFGGAKQVMIV